MASLISRLLGKLKNRLRPKDIPNQQYSHIAASATVYSTVKLINEGDIHIGDYSEIKDYVIIQCFGSVKIGKYCQLNPFTVLYAGHIEIGDYVMIAPHCMISSGNHDYKQTEKPMRLAGDLYKGPIVIEDDVWIGANVTITDGVRIGKGAVVAANSCVITDVPSYSIVGGVPAKVISSRK